MNVVTASGGDLAVLNKTAVCGIIVAYMNVVTASGEDLAILIRQQCVVFKSITWPGHLVRQST